MRVYGFFIVFYDGSKLNITSVSDTRTGRGYRYKNRSQGQIIPAEPNPTRGTDAAGHSDMLNAIYNTLIHLYMTFRAVYTALVWYSLYYGI